MHVQRYLCYVYAHACAHGSQRSASRVFLGHSLPFGLSLKLKLSSPARLRLFLHTQRFSWKLRTELRYSRQVPLSQREPQLRRCLPQLGLWAFSWLMIMWQSPAHHGQWHLWAGGPGQHKNTGWTKHKNLEGKHFVDWAVSLALALYTHQLETRIACHALWIIHSSFHYQHVSFVSWESLVSKR